MMDKFSSCRLGRKMLYAFFAAGTVLLAGSLSPERLTMPKAPERPEIKEILAMTKEIPADRRAAWSHAAEQDALTLFRITCTGR